MSDKSPRTQHCVQFDKLSIVVRGHNYCLLVVSCVYCWFSVLKLPNIVVVPSLVVADSRWLSVSVGLLIKILTVGAQLWQRSWYIYFVCPVAEFLDVTGGKSSEFSSLLFTNYNHLYYLIPPFEQKWCSTLMNSASVKKNINKFRRSERWMLSFDPV